MKICLFCATFGPRGYVWDYSWPGRVMWGTIGSMPTNIIIIGEFVLRIRRKAFLNLIFSLPGRRHCQLRLVEPSYKSINSGDCYLLITPQRSFVWVGEYANVIEKAKVCLLKLLALVDKAMASKHTNSKSFSWVCNVLCSRLHLVYWIKSILTLMLDPKNSMIFLII